MNKYVVKVNVVNANGTTSRMSVPVEASSAGAARNKVRADLDRQVAARTLRSYGALSVRNAR